MNPFITLRGLHHCVPHQVIDVIEAGDGMFRQVEFRDLGQRFFSAVMSRAKFFGVAASEYGALRRNEMRLATRAFSARRDYNSGSDEGAMDVPVMASGK